MIGDVSGPHDSSSLMLSPAHTCSAQPDSITGPVEGMSLRRQGDNVVSKSITGIMLSTNAYKSLAMSGFVGTEH